MSVSFLVLLSVIYSVRVSNSILLAECIAVSTFLSFQGIKKLLAVTSAVLVGTFQYLFFIAALFKRPYSSSSLD